MEWLLEGKVQTIHWTSMAKLQRIAMASSMMHWILISSAMIISMESATIITMESETMIAMKMMI